ncbi:sporulation inhibitor of replication protein SirA [Amphibacillus cookii]|uniref:sporulation inhibitor of replication protein SirA n=1 Tax=Amphibacillus cookii TaxID=767787 RepID=UPI0019591491|nr:sporulation inhibitor of replication protein SirA [Amphibacillus cookii]MBM7540781.1 hypothetical protein [Amphibacillus cookii]
MNRYYIFFLKAEVYHHYFYKAALLNRFFHKYMSQPDRSDLEKQFFYITRPIPTKDNIQTQQIEITNNRMMTIFSSAQCILDHPLLYDLEDQNHHCFIVDHTYQHFGWLSPLHKMSSPIYKVESIDTLTHPLNQLELIKSYCT